LRGREPDLPIFGVTIGFKPAAIRLTGDVAFACYWVAFSWVDKFDHIIMIKRTSKTTSDYIEKYPGKKPVKAVSGLARARRL
jgi:hypothetical protein